jgi:hypothetical protein
MAYKNPEDRKAYREANREKITAYKKAWREANREKIEAYNTAYREANKERIKARDKAYRETNKETLAAKTKAWRETHPEKALLKRARARANKIGQEFNIDESDIVIPAVCPILGIELKLADGRMEPGSPSLDRIDNSKGYIKGNVAVISNRANRIKSNCTADDLRRIAEWIDEQLGGDHE